MPETSKKGVKRYNSPQTQQRKRKKRVYTKKAKKGVPRDFWQALVFAAVLITASALISIAVLGIKRGKISPVRQLPEPTAELAAELMSQPIALPEAEPDVPAPEPTAPEIPLSGRASRQEHSAPSPAKKPPAVSKPSGEKQASVNSAKKAPANKPDNRQPVKTSRAQPAAPPQLPPKPAHQGTLVFIIDDAGNNLKELEPFLRFPGPLTIAVLPGLPHSVEAARRIRAAGKEVFLHQPMEASGGRDPGPGAIYAGMDAAEILATLNQNIAEVGPVAGINNHQGSRITADQQAMETVLGFCREQGISFLDSRTTASTAAPAAARNLGIKIGERNIFIDNEQDRLSMSRSIESGLVWASQKGSAVMIGHIWSPELAPLLAEFYQNIIAQGYTLAPASDLVK